MEMLVFKNDFSDPLMEIGCVLFKGNEPQQDHLKSLTVPTRP